MAEQDLACHWCGMDDQLEPADIKVKVANPQLDFDHTIYHCGRCGKLTAVARWGNQQYVYRAIEYPRRYRASIYVLVYDIACSWCGRGDMLEPEEINATVGNPASARHHYDIYACHACDRYTAVSYLGQVFTYPATQDERYPSMYYLEVGDEE
ncbi:MAG: hypothetical protein ACJ8CR_14855 [Roseiflexaceae bacterium]